MHRKNNFDFLRLLFASFVVITHSYSLSGIKENDLLYQLTGHLTFSDFGVKGFFIISGFLVFQSLERSESLATFYWKRVLRLFPGLLVVLLLTVIFGAFVYEGNIVSYLQNKTMWTYIPKNLSLYKRQFSISGIFKNNPYKSTINGSLWTLSYEFTMYLFLSLLFFIKKDKKILKIILSLLFTGLLIGNLFFIEKAKKYGFILGSKYLLDFSVSFFAGSLLAVLKIEKNKYNNLLLLFSGLLIIVSLRCNFFDTIKYLLLPVLIILGGIQSTPILNSIGSKIGDLSYGIYIYGFPIQQTLEHFFKLRQIQLQFWGLTISILLAYFSWHLIESKALRLKKYLSNDIQSV